MPKTVRLQIAGDIMLGAGVLDKIEKHGPLFPFERIKEVTRSSDIFFANLECTLFKTRNPPFPTKILLHSNPRVVEGLYETGIRIVSLANNHSFDYGYEGYRRTKAALEKYGIRSVGGGRSIREASECTLLVINGIRLAFLGYCSEDTGRNKFAGECEGGVASLDRSRIEKSIEQAKRESDIVIVSLHWGHEFSDYPLPQDIKTARSLVDTGAAIVVGSHAHVFQGHEKYKNGLIVYDLGSFIFGDIKMKPPKDYKFILKKRKHKEGIIIECELTKSGLVGFKFIPIEINADFQPFVPGIPRCNRILERFLGQSANLSRTHYESFYKRYIPKFNAECFIRGLRRKLSY